jgi:hypothetical protein
LPLAAIPVASILEVDTGHDTQTAFSVTLPRRPNGA